MEVYGTDEAGRTHTVRTGTQGTPYTARSVYELQLFSVN